MERLADGLLWYVVFLFSTTVHEAAHAFAAYKFGDRTAYEGGQVTLNPIPHIRRAPVGTVVVPILSFFLGGWMIGWASTPYDRNWALQYPRRSALMSVAGPLANLFLVLLAAALIHVGISLGYFYPPESITFSSAVASHGEGFAVYAASLLSVLFSLNLILMAFNLLPVPPLDGSGIVPLFLDAGTGRKYMTFIQNPSFGYLGLMIAWKAFDYLFSPLHLLAINLLYPGVQYQ